MNKMKKVLIASIALTMFQLVFADKYIPLSRGAKIECPKGTLTKLSTLADVEKFCVIDADDYDHDFYDNEYEVYFSDKNKKYIKCEFKTDNVKEKIANCKYKHSYHH